MILIREARPEDAARIAEIHVRAWQEAYRGIMPDDFLAALLVAPERVERWRETLARGDRTVLVAEEAGGMAGWVIGGASRDADAPPRTAEVYAINIDPAVWRRGAGRSLMQHVCARFRGAGHDRVTLWVLAENQAARRFYLCLGFTCDDTAGGRKTVSFGGRELIEVRYSLRLDR
jgi:ribosomal protein S18 acetylase RimI-like enzyme